METTGTKAKSPHKQFITIETIPRVIEVLGFLDEMHRQRSALIYNCSFSAGAHHYKMHVVVYHNQQKETASFDILSSDFVNKFWDFTEKCKQILQ